MTYDELVDVIEASLDMWREERISNTRVANHIGSDLLAAGLELT